jgi:hypothetical protein
VYIPLEDLEKPHKNLHADLQLLFVSPMQLSKSHETLQQEDLGKSVKIINLFPRRNSEFTANLTS